MVALPAPLSSRRGSWLLEQHNGSCGVQIVSHDPGLAVRLERQLSQKGRVFLLETDSYSEINMLGAPRCLPSSGWALMVDGLRVSMEGTPGRRV